MQRLEQAYLTASELHRGQVRKAGGTPYIGHPMAVAALLIEAGENEDVIIAGLLHDVIEDAGGEDAAQRIRDEFGEEVLAIVRECSEDKMPDRDKKDSWRDRKEHHLASMRTASPAAAAVIAADKLHNARAMIVSIRENGTEKHWSQFNAGMEDCLWYYREAAEALDHVLHSALSRELLEAVRTLDRLCGGQE